MTIEDGIFEVTATAGDTRLGTEDFHNQIVDVRVQDAKRKNRGKDLAGNHLAVCHVRTECERAKRTSYFSMQATTEIDALLDGTAFPLAFWKAWFKELNMDYLRNARGPLEQPREAVATEASTCAVCMMSSTLLVSLEGTDQSMKTKRSLFFVAGRHFAVHGVEDSWWCDDEADRLYHINSHE